LDRERTEPSDEVLHPCELLLALRPLQDLQGDLGDLRATLLAGLQMPRDLLAEPRAEGPFRNTIVHVVEEEILSGVRA
jgi:hypothetical protein